jgi:putative chitinase
MTSTVTKRTTSVPIHKSTADVSVHLKTSPPPSQDADVVKDATPPDAPRKTQRARKAIPLDSRKVGQETVPARSIHQQLEQWNPGDPSTAPKDVGQVKDPTKTAPGDGVTPDQLKRIAPSMGDEKATEYAPLINSAMKEFGIDTPLRQAHFLAQISHETDGFRTMEEYSSGRQYNGRKKLGNRPGTNDGVTYKGRGAIQLTGRYNYDEAGKDLGVDLINNPRRAEDPDLAFRVAGWFWSKNNINDKADNNDLEGVTRKINGGTNGIKDRGAYFKRASEELGL